MKHCIISPDITKEDFRSSCEALGIDPEHPYAAQLLESCVEDAQFAFAEGFAELYDPCETYEA